MTRRLPALLAEPRPAAPPRFAGGWAAWCCWCRGWHLHGVGLGHRAAHCDESSPFLETGYELVRPSVWQIEELLSEEERAVLRAVRAAGKMKQAFTVHQAARVLRGDKSATSFTSEELAKAAAILDRLVSLGFVRLTKGTVRLAEARDGGEAR